MQITNYIVFPVYGIQYSMDGKKQKREQQKREQQKRENKDTKKDFSKTLSESSSAFCRHC